MAPTTPPLTPAADLDLPESIATNADAMIILTQGYPAASVISVVDAWVKRAIAASRRAASGEFPADLIADFRDAIEVARHRAEHAGDTNRKKRWIEARRRLDEYVEERRAAPSLPDVAMPEPEFTVADPDLNALLNAAADWGAGKPQNMDTGMYLADLIETVEKRLAAQPAEGSAQVAKAERQNVDWLGLALDLEQQAKRVESQTVERAMLAAANGLRLMGAAPGRSDTPAAVDECDSALRAEPAGQHEAYSPTDGEIEAAFIAALGQWNGDQWVIEDADLHPFVRTVLVTRCRAEGGVTQDDNSKFPAASKALDAAAPAGQRSAEECVWCDGTGSVRSDDGDPASEDECQRCRGSGMVEGGDKQGAQGDANASG